MTEPPACFKIEPSGDTLIILEKDAPQGNAQEEPREEPADDHQDAPLGETQGQEVASDDQASLPTRSEVHFLVSKKHLAVASRRAHRMFGGAFKEATPDADGLFHWKFEPVFRPEALLVVLEILHGKTRDIPPTVSLEQLAHIAVVVDDLECHNAVWFFARQWISHLRWSVHSVLEYPGREAKLKPEDISAWILVSFVFEDAALFSKITKLAICSSPSSVPTHGYPIRPKIIQTIEKERSRIIAEFTQLLEGLETNLLRKQMCSNFSCRAILLGTLVQAMADMSLYHPRSPEILDKLSITSILDNFHKFMFPVYGLDPLLGQSLRTTVSTSSNTPAAGVLFGTKTAATNQNGTPTGTGLLDNSTRSTNPTATGTSLFGGNTRSAPPATGGLFGNSSTSSQSPGNAVNSSSTKPPAAGGLFGSAPANPPVGGGLFRNTTTTTQYAATEHAPCLTVLQQELNGLKNLQVELNGLVLGNFPN